MTTGWLKDAAGLDAALGQAAVPPAVASLTPGLHRKSTYSGMSMGSKVGQLCLLVLRCCGLA